MREVIAAAIEAIEKGQPAALATPVDRGGSRPTLYIVGAGHVGLALARIAPTAGFGVAVLDDRPEFASAARFPMAETVRVCDFDRVFDGLPVDGRSYIAVMTRGHAWDREVVEQALRLAPAYIGMMGSRRKIALTWEALGERGVTPAQLASVHAPIGLDIGGDTPGEIAVSILAELIKARRRGDTAVGGGKVAVPWDEIVMG